MSYVQLSVGGFQVVSPLWLVLSDFRSRPSHTHWQVYTIYMGSILFTFTHLYLRVHVRPRLRLGLRLRLCLCLRLPLLHSLHTGKAHAFVLWSRSFQPHKRQLRRALHSPGPDIVHLHIPNATEERGTGSRRGRSLYYTLATWAAVRTRNLRKMFMQNVKGTCTTG